MIAFGDDEAGDPFCLEAGRSGVSCWYDLEGRKKPLATVDIAAFWRGWTGGTITTWGLVPPARIGAWSVG